MSVLICNQKKAGRNPDREKGGKKKEKLNEKESHIFLALITLMGLNIDNKILILFLWSFLLLILFSKYDNIDIYMDEIFHIPQAQKFCNGNFIEWDSKITTFPGLYLLSFIINNVLSYECSVIFLRGINVFLAILWPYYLYQCRRTIFPREDEIKDTVIMITIIILYPVALFYYFLYYTDTASVVSITMLYMEFKKAIIDLDSKSRRNNVRITRSSHNNIISGSNLPSISMWQFFKLYIFSSTAILMRQTNIVWVAFIGATGVLDYLKVEVTNGPISSLTMYFHSIFMFIKSLWTKKIEIFSFLLPLLLPCIACMFFVIMNGSIVLGDKDNHTPVVHLSMMLHPLLILAGMYGPFSFIDNMKILFKPSSSFINNIIKIMIIFIITVFVLLYSVKEHRFLTDDNRHYTFYIWKYLLQSPYKRLMLSPIYSFASVTVGIELNKRRGLLWLTFFFGAMAITLIPAPLLEPRYFTTPIVIAFLNTPSRRYTDVLFCIILMVLVNYYMIDKFINQPFQWPDTSTARFMP